MKSGNIVEASEEAKLIRTYYDIEPRQYSSDCVVMVRETKIVRKNGKTSFGLHKELVLIPTQKKKLGDEMAKKMVTVLNEDTQHEF